MQNDELKKQVGQAAVREVEAGMHIGIGTGSTAEAFIVALAELVASGLDITGVPTSNRTENLCRDLGIPLASLSEAGPLDLTIDGADEVSADLQLIKGGGGAHLREKIVASASSRMIVIADQSKIVDQLGAFPLPVELVTFDADYTARMVQAMLGEILEREVEAHMRRNEQGEPFVTDAGNTIYDYHCGVIPDPGLLALALDTVPGVVEHGLFVDIAELALIATDNGVQRIYKAQG